MSKQMLINAIHAEESRVAIVEKGVLEEIGVETAAAERHKGNIYKGTVVRVEPSLEVAFVEYGERKNGFLPFREIHHSYYKCQKNAKGRPRIQDVISKGMEVLIQVVREERDQKGAYMTTYLSIPGRFLVVMPGSKSGGVSRKIEDDEQRSEMKKILKDLNVPEGFGVIIRTAGLDIPKTILAREMKFLLKVWDQILQNATEQETPSLVYRESDLVTRSIRDYFTTEIQEVLIDNMEVYKKTVTFFQQIMPRYRNRVKLYQGAKPIFAKHNLEEQIERIYERKVPLQSGGSIVIEPTEALVSIDVNSGKSMRAKGIEETAFSTNMEAAEEVARQLRLRDLGGLIVVDFIDMVSKKHQQEVVKCIKACMKGEKAKTEVSTISRFGLLSISRQRIHAPVESGTYVPCDQCGGTGRVRSLGSIALTILRTIQMHVAKGNVAVVEGEVSTELADFLLNQKRGEIVRMETMHKVQIHLKRKGGLYHHLYHLDFIEKKAEKEEKPVEQPSGMVEPKKELDDNGTHAKKSKGKRRYRRKAAPKQEK